MELMLVFLRVLGSLLRVWLCACLRDHVPGAICPWWGGAQSPGSAGSGPGEQSCLVLLLFLFLRGVLSRGRQVSWPLSLGQSWAQGWALVWTGHGGIGRPGTCLVSSLPLLASADARVRLRLQRRPCSCRQCWEHPLGSRCELWPGSPRAQPCPGGQSFCFLAIRSWLEGALRGLSKSPLVL